jgi:APA family basic amino acid/polyamine antiporter
VGFATFLSSLSPALMPFRTALAVAAVTLLTALNCLGVVAGGRAQTLLTAAKVGAIVVLVGGALALSPLVPLEDVMSPQVAEVPSMAAFGAAMVGALWAYAGWANLPMAAGEVVDPARTLPRAIVAGTLTVTVIYLLVNATYFLVLPFEDVASSSSVAHPDAQAVGAKAAQAFLGPAATSALLLAFAVSALGTLNGMLLTTARIGFAMARDGWLPAPIGAVAARSAAPVAALVGLGLLTVVLVAAGSLDRLATGATLGYWVFHVLCGCALFVVRARSGETAGHVFRVPWYPIVPGVFVGSGALLIAASLWTAPVEAAWVAGVIATGVIASHLFRRKLG